MDVGEAVNKGVFRMNVELYKNVIFASLVEFPRSMPEFPGGAKRILPEFPQHSAGASGLLLTTIIEFIAECCVV